MKYVPFTFTSKDNLTLQGRAWLSQEHNPKGTLYLLHDLGEHSARYAHVAESFSNEGYHFVGFDMRGHGLSAGRRGQASKFTKLINDVEQVICQSTNQFGLTRDTRILYGQGFGGNLALNYILRRKPNLSGAIVTSVILNTPFTKTKSRRTLLHFIANIFHKMRINSHIKSKDLSRDLAFVKAYQDDVYNYHKISARLAVEIYRNGKYIMNHIDTIELPLLFMHGTSNRITPAEISSALAERAGKMADILLWENGYHELHNDLERNLVIKRMIAWLDKEIKT